MWGKKSKQKVTVNSCDYTFIFIMQWLLVMIFCFMYLWASVL